MASLEYRLLADIPPRHPVAVFAEEWYRLRDLFPEAKWPQREAFRPFNHPRILEWLMLVQVSHDGSDRKNTVKVMGTRIEQALGVFSTGQEYGEWMDPANKKQRLEEIAKLEELAEPQFSFAMNPNPEKTFQRLYRGSFPLGTADTMTHFVLVFAPVDVELS